MKITIPLSAITICLLFAALVLISIIGISWIWGVAAVFVYGFIEMVQFFFIPRRK